MEQERLEYEARQKDKAKREKLRKDILAPNTGMFTYAIDRQTFEALEYVMKRQWGNSFFVDSEEQEIYVPENLDIHEVKHELLLSGFYMEIKKKSHAGLGLILFRASGMPSNGRIGKEKRKKESSKQLTRKMKPSRKWNRKGWNTRQDGRREPKRKS